MADGELVKEAPSVDEAKLFQQQRGAASLLKVRDGGNDGQGKLLLVD